MKILPRILLALAVSAPCALNTQAQTLSNPNFEEVLRVAKQEKKPILLEFYTTWCPSCQELERSVFPAPEVKKALGNFVFVRYDNDSDTGAQINERFLVRSYPTFIFLDQAGNETARNLSSYDSPAQMTDALTKALHQKVAAGAVDASPQAVLEKLQSASERGDEPETRSLLEQLKRSDPKNGKDMLAQGMYALAELLRGLRRFSAAARLQMELAKRFPDSSAAEDAAFMVGYNLRSGALDQAAAFYKKMIADHPQKALWYSAFADLCATNRYRLSEGFGMIHKAIELEPQSASHYHTLARLYYRKDDLAAAVEAMEKAVELSPKNRPYTERLLRYQAEWLAVDITKKN